MRRVLVDASAAFDQRAGVGRYARNIIERLVPAEPETAWTLFHAPERRGIARAGWDAPEAARIAQYPLGRRRFDQLAGRLGLPLPVRPLVGSQDVLYSPDFLAPAMRSVPRIVTIHDLAFLTHPHLTTPGTAEFLITVVRRAARRGAYIATVSETTRERVERLLDVPPGRLRVIPNGVDQRFFDATPLSWEDRHRLGVPDAYHLMVGTIEPRKNHATVLRSLQRGESEHPVVVVGRVGWGVERLVPELEALERTHRLAWLRDLDDSDLPALYAGATSILYPSWTEGFGLPVLEGLAAGKPVITGDDPVFAEAGGGQVTMLPPADAEAIADAMQEAERGRSPAHIVMARQAWASRYNWDEPVARLRRWLDELSGGPGG